MAKAGLNCASTFDVVARGAATYNLVESKLRTQIHCTCRETSVNLFSSELIAVTAAIDNVQRQHVSENADPCFRKEFRR